MTAGRVIPRPAVKRRAAPGTGASLSANDAALESVPRLTRGPGCVVGVVLELGEAGVLDDECTILHGRAAVADDEARLLEHGRGCRLRASLTRRAGREADEDQ